MNKTYRTVFNTATGTYVAASELAPGRNKGKTALALVAAATLSLSGAAFAADDTDEEDETEQPKLSVLAMAPRSIGVMSGQFGGGNGISLNYGGAGSNAVANGDIAIGGDAVANSGANGNNNFSIAIGDSASVGNASTIVTNGVAIGTQATASHNNSVALGSNSKTDRANSVSIGSAGNERQIVNVAAGTANTDAVNVGQMNTALSTKVDNTLIKLGGGTAATVSGRSTNIAIGAGSESTGGAGNSGTIAIGEAAKASGNASSIAIGANTEASGQSAVAMGIRSKATNLNSMALGHQASATANGAIALGADSVADVANTVSVGNATTQRKIVNMAAGAVSSTSTDAINGGQLYGVADSVASAIGGGASVNADGSIKAPSFTLGDGKGGTTTVNNVGAVVTNLNGRVTSNETSITDLQKAVGSGTVGLVQQAAAGGKLTVGKDADGTEVDFTSKDGTGRKLTGLANGAVAPGSKDAVTGDQLNTTNTNVTHLGTRVSTAETNITDLQKAVGSGTVGLVQQAAAGGKLTVGKDTDGTEVEFTNKDGTGRKLTGLANGAVAPGSKDAVTGDQLNTTNTNVSALSTRVTASETNITDLQTKIGSGSIGLVQQDATTHAINVAAATGGTSVNFAGTDGVRVLSGVGAGVANTDAVSVGQLKSVIGYNMVDPLDPLMATRYDSADMKSVTFGGDPLFGTVLHNVGMGAITPDSKDAVNGSQLFATNEKIAALDGRVSGLESVVGSGSGTGDGSGAPGTGGPGSTVVGAGSAASGDNSTAVGAGAIATGGNSTALGQGSTATGNNSVAIGAGSMATRDNEVSFGSAGNERVLGNVAEGVRDTDAVNKGQMDRAIGGVQNQIADVSRTAYAGIAAATALSMIPGVDPGKTLSLGIGTANYQGYQAVALGGEARINANIKVKAGVGMSSAATTVGAGASYQW
ncbi:hypothetical protein LMG18090_01033 [Ralstonia mannitolilytica]|uniref:YadA-like family protein n=1 Tax=Ralstonia mannitolilytica TaxID=105219 RepID=UPI0028F56485|nr:YadA-like family protein [Ralstonia mannitolilytica]CAJ0779132.1 hypothetical protein LMG18090_01033 [Ralstonia mannitolilytica]